MKVFLLVILVMLSMPVLYGNSLDVDEVVRRAEEYCSRMEKSAFRYFCLETIEEEFIPLPKYFRYSPAAYNSHIRSNRRVNTYVYDYQMIKKGPKIKEQRVLLKKNGKKIGKTVNKTQLKTFYSKRSFFGPIGLVGSQSLPLYNYKLINVENGIAVVEALLKKRSAGRCSGKLWVNIDSGAVKKIEVDVRSMPGYMYVNKFELHWGTKADIKVAHEYSLEHNGLYYPVKTTFVEKYAGGMGMNRKFPRDGTYHKSKVEIKYIKYKFFDVNAKVADSREAGII